MLGMAGQRCHLKPWLQSFLQQGISQGKKQQNHTKTHRDGGEQVPNLPINFRAHRGDSYRKRAELPPNPTAFSFYWLTFPSSVLFFHRQWALETQTLRTQLPAPRKNKEEQQKMANVKRLQQWRLKHRPALSPEREKEILQGKMEIAASTNTDAINTPPTHLKWLFKYSKELKRTQTPNPQC